MNKICKKQFWILAFSVFLMLFNFCDVKASDNSEVNISTVSRLGGKDRFETSQKICEQFAKEGISNVIIANGNNFPDALTGSVLSKKLNAPILLVDKTLNGSSNSIKYIENNLSKDGTIFILGSKGVVEDKFISYFNNKGYKNIKRLGGNDRFDTNKIIVDNLKVDKGTPVVIVTGQNFPDALSISSIAAIKGYPILMSKKDNLPETIKNAIKDIKPSKVFLIGSEGVVANSIVSEVENLVPKIQPKNIVRICGKDRYETSLSIVRYFKNELANKYAVIAVGSNFPDALSGGALASKLGAPILLTDGSNILTQKRFMDENKISNIILLGSKFCIGEGVENILAGKEEHLFYIKNAYEKQGEKYITGEFIKQVKDLQEALDYKRILKDRVSLGQDEDGFFIEDDGVDIPISDKIDLKVSDNCDMDKITYDYDQGIKWVKTDFNELMREDVPKFTGKIKIKDGIVTKIHQEYRP